MLRHNHRTILAPAQCFHSISGQLACVIDWALPCLVRLSFLLTQKTIVPFALVILLVFIGVVHILLVGSNLGYGVKP